MHATNRRALVYLHWFCGQFWCAQTVRTCCILCACVVYVLMEWTRSDLEHIHVWSCDVVVAHILRCTTCTFARAYLISHRQFCFIYSEHIWLFIPTADCYVMECVDVYVWLLLSFHIHNWLWQVFKFACVCVCKCVRACQRFLILVTLAIRPTKKKKWQKRRRYYEREKENEYGANLIVVCVLCI